MPDITMCASDGCPLAHHCYRSPQSGTQSSEWRQAWGYFEWTVGVQGAYCAHYEPTHPPVTASSPPAQLQRRA